MNEKTEEDIMEAIARRTFGEGLTRKELRAYVERNYGEKGSIILSKMWLNRFLAVDSYNDVNVTGRWADHRISLEAKEKSVVTGEKKE